MIENKKMDRNIDKRGRKEDAMADKAFQLSGGRRFPVVVINGGVIVGYSPDKFLEHLKGWGG